MSGIEVGDTIEQLLKDPLVSDVNHFRVDSFCDGTERLLRTIQRSNDADVENLRKLQADWDGRGALIPSPESIDLLQEYIAGLKGLHENNTLLFNVRVVPDADGLAIAVLTPRGERPCSYKRITVCFDAEENSVLVASTHTETKDTSITVFNHGTHEEVVRLHKYLQGLR